MKKKGGQRSKKEQEIIETGSMPKKSKRHMEEHVTAHHKYINYSTIKLINYDKMMHIF